ncbi:MFS transporter [Streptomyces populi]
MPRLVPDTGPQRVLAASDFAYTVGSGLYLTAGVLYFTEAVHLPAGQVGLGLGIAGLLALVLGVAVGHLADRHGARGVYAATLVVQALATACFVLADSFWPFVLAVCAAAAAKAAGIAARSPLIRHYGGDRPQEFRARLRAVTNVGIMAVQFKVLTVAVLLWIVDATTAPHWLISATMLTGTVIVVAFQVRVGRDVDSPAAGAHAHRRAGVAFLIVCSLVSLSAGIPAWASGALLITAVVIHTIGELWHSAAGFEISFALAPQHSTGQYLGVFGLGAGLAEALGPGLLIALCITWGRPGWYVTGAMFALTGLTAPPAVRCAQRHRHAPRTQPVPAEKASAA